MRRIIFISSGILFICIAAALVIIGSNEKDNILIIFSGMAIPFLFVGFWNIYNVFYERKFYKAPVSAESPLPAAGRSKSSGLDLQGDSAETSDSYFTYKSGLTSFGAGAFYNKKIIVPVFIIMFGTAALAIVNAFIASSRSTEDIGIAVLAFSFLYALVLTIYFLKQLNKELKEPATENGLNKSTIDDIGFKIAFFFATVATLGLFALGWWIYKKIKL